MRKNRIVVQSHVARDFLQNAAYFSTVPKVVWEYVSNSLDNAEEGRPAQVAVELSSNLLRISDNGSGMSRKELQNFFMMHGENVQRSRGKRVRGRFGTGKCEVYPKSWTVQQLKEYNTPRGYTWVSIERLHLNSKPTWCSASSAVSTPRRNSVVSINSNRSNCPNGKPSLWPTPHTFFNATPKRTRPRYASRNWNNWSVG